jgi:hypothetical protein
MSGLQRRPAILPDERLILVPYDRREALSIEQAAERAGKSASTLRNWCEQHGIGRRIGNGHWEVSRVALQMFLDGDRNALACYHRNNRDPILMGYFEHVGLGCLVG